MKDPKNIALAAMVLVVFILIGVLVFKNQPTTINTTKYDIERANLEAQASMQQRIIENMQQQENVLRDSIRILQQLPKQIHERHETNRADNWNLDDSAAIELWHQRLRAEREYRKRFQYNK